MQKKEKKQEMRMKGGKNISEKEMERRGKDANLLPGRKSGKDKKSVRMDRMVRKDEKRMEKENDCFGGEGRNRRFSPSCLAFSSAFSFPFSFLLFFFFVKKQQKKTVFKH